MFKIHILIPLFAYLAGVFDFSFYLYWTQWFHLVVSQPPTSSTVRNWVHFIFAYIELAS